MSKLDDFIDKCHAKHIRSEYSHEEIIAALVQWYMAYQQEPVCYSEIINAGHNDIKRVLWGVTRVGAPKEYMLIEDVGDVVTNLKLTDYGMDVLREEGLLK